MACLNQNRLVATYDSMSLCLRRYVMAEGRGAYHIVKARNNDPGPPFQQVGHFILLGRSNAHLDQPISYNFYQRYAFRSSRRVTDQSGRRAQCQLSLKGKYQLRDP